MRSYATESDLSQWMAPEPVPANAAGLLRSATNLIRHETRLARYPVHGGQPTEPDIREAFKDATTEQARYWAANGLDPAAGTLTEETGKVVSSKAIKGASVSYDTAAAAQAKQARLDALSTLAPEAWQILSNAGLIGRDVRVL